MASPDPISPSSPPLSAAPGLPGDGNAAGGINPFEQDALRWICAANAGGSVEELHREALDRLRSAVDANLATGGLLLLTSPRAGYGKTHLLSRLADELQGTATLLPVVLRPGEPITIARLCHRSLEALQRISMPAEHWTGLRQASAEIISKLVHGLIMSGRLACANQDQALRVLAGPVAEVFGEKGRARAIGDWLRQNGAQLSPSLAALATEKCSPLRQITPQWIEALMEQASAGDTAGLALLDELSAGGDASSWLRLLGGTGPLIIAFDHADGFHRDAASGVLIASLMVELAEVYGATVIFSVNQDVWQGTFGSHLPSSLEDRLTAAQVSLRGLDGATAAALAAHRLRSADIEDDEAAEFAKFLAADRFFLGRPVGSVSIRTFLRHAARQWEIFKHSVPSPDEAQEPSPWLPAPEVANEDRSIIPLMPDLEGGTGRGGALPAIFDEDTTALVKGIAGGLAETSTRIPEATVTPHLPPPSPSPAESPPLTNELPQATESSGSVAPTPDAFEKLREMLGKLRQPSQVGEAAAWTSREEAPAAFEQSDGPAVATLEGEGEKTDILRGRFEALRMQMSAEADSQPLDLGKVTELIRLAGRRFPLVKASEQELPGMNGRQVMCWSLQGVEILFGLAQFSDTAYWKTLGAYAAGRWAEMGENVSSTAKGCKVKIAAFKTDREQAAYQALLSSGALGEPAQSCLDAIHLDTGSTASLYAMQRIVKEAESGALSVEPAQVMSALARELDFFWRRVTRLG